MEMLYTLCIKPIKLVHEVTIYVFLCDISEVLVSFKSLEQRELLLKFVNCDCRCVNKCICYAGDLHDVYDRTVFSGFYLPLKW